MRQRELLLDHDLLDVPADAELDAVVRVAASVAGVPTATVNILDTERQCSIATVGFAGADVPRDESLCHVTSRLGRVWVSSDLSQEPFFAHNAFVDGRFGALRFYASVPLVVQGVPIGTLCVFDDVPRTLSAEQVHRLTDLAGVVVALLERRRQARRTERLAATTEQARTALAAAHADLARARAFDRALLDALPVGVVAADASGRVTLFNQVVRDWLHTEPGGYADGERLVARYNLMEADGVTPLAPDQVPLTRALAGERLSEGHELVIAPDGLPRRSVRIRAVPVYDAAGRPLGAVATMADVSAQRALEQQLRAAAMHDALTGLPNRALLVDRLEHALAATSRDGSIAVLYCDLDGFKAVNDHHGHAVGDQVLREAAARMSHAVRPGDTVGRIGGDEFVVLCPGVPDAAQAEAIAARVAASLEQPMSSADGTDHHVGVSIGIAISTPGQTPETMLTAADEAMYVVKAQHRAAR